MSGRGNGRNRRGKKVRPLVTAITGTQPSSSTPEDDILGSSSHPLQSPDGPDHVLSPPTETTIEELPERDSQGRIILSISVLKLFYGAGAALKSPARWFSDLLNGRQHTEFWPTSKYVPESVFEHWWSDFKEKYCWPKHTDKEAKDMLKFMCKNRYRDWVYELKKDWKEGEKPPINITEEVYAKFVAHWQDPAVEQASARAKRNRVSTSGTGVKHTTGSINVAEHQARMIQTYGLHINYLDVFVSTHTIAGATDQSPVWVDEIAETTYNAYLSAIDVEVAEGRVERAEGEGVPFVASVWQAVVSSQGRKKRGKRLYGLGEHGAGLFPSSSQGSPGQSHTQPTPAELAIIEELQARMARQDEIMAEQARTMADQQRALSESQQAMAAQAKLMAEMNARMEAFINSRSTSSSPRTSSPSSFM